MPISRDQIRGLLVVMLNNKGFVFMGPPEDEAELTTFGFRSLDFSELVLRVEDELDVELNFEAAGPRQVRTIGDVLDYVEAMAAET